MSLSASWDNWVAAAGDRRDSPEVVVGASQDADDIALSLRGDEQAYARIVRRYQPLIARQLWKYTRDPGQLDELVQEVFVEAYTSLRGFRGDAPLLHWLRCITTRTGYRFWRLQAQRRERETALDRTGELRAAKDEYAAAEAAEVAHALLAQLPPRDRLVLTLLYLEERDTREIADETGWSVAMVKVQAFRARQKLKKLLEQQDFGWPPERRAT
jgi:RNA polymerase sigma-70 factor (ECF subfamily)